MPQTVRFISNPPLLPELLKLRDISKKRSFKVSGTRTVKEMIPGNEGAYEIELTIKNQHADIIGFRLYNDKGEEVDMQYDMKENKFSMDRRKSGDVSFNENFPTLTWTAIESGRNELKLRLFVDKSSVEAFGDGGRFAMTNQVSRRSLTAISAFTARADPIR